MSETNKSEEKIWYLYILDHQEGPFSESEVQKLLHSERIKETNYVWKAGMEDWSPISQVQDLKNDSSLSSTSISTKKLSSSLEKEKTLAARANQRRNLEGQIREKIWTLNSNGKHLGPFSMAEIVLYVLREEAHPMDFIWREGWTGWQMLSKDEWFKDKYAIARTWGLSEWMKKYQLSARPLESEGGEAHQLPPSIPQKKIKLENVSLDPLSKGEKILNSLDKTGQIALSAISNFTNKMHATSEVKVMNLDKIQDYSTASRTQKVLEKEDHKARIKKLSFFGFCMIALLVMLTQMDVGEFFKSERVKFAKPDKISLPEYEVLLSASQQDLADGIKIEYVIGMPENIGKFHFASNLPKGTTFSAKLISIKNTLVGLKKFKYELPLVIKSGGYGLVKFSKGSKLLYPGKYRMIIKLDTSQNETVNDEIDSYNISSYLKIFTVFIPTEGKEPYPLQLKKYLSRIIIDKSPEKIATGNDPKKEHRNNNGKLDFEQIEVEQLVGTLDSAWGILKNSMENLINQSKEGKKDFSEYSKSKSFQTELTNWKTNSRVWFPILMKIKENSLKVNVQNARDFKFPNVYIRSAKWVNLLEENLKAWNQSLEKGTFSPKKILRDINDLSGEFKILTNELPNLPTQS